MWLLVAAVVALLRHKHTQQWGDQIRIDFGAPSPPQANSNVPIEIVSMMENDVT